MVSPPKPQSRQSRAPEKGRPTLDEPKLPQEPLVEVMPPLPGIPQKVYDTLTRRGFVDITEIGGGAMGDVYAARHELLAVERVIKVLKPNMTGEAEARFVTEGRILAAMDNRHVVKVHDSFEEDGGRYIVFEHLKGATVGAMIYPDGDEKPGTPFDVKLALNVVAQACIGIEAAHNRGIIHRDIKPDNLFVTTDENGQYVVKVLDFGVVKIVDNATPKLAETGMGQIIGTPQFMSPEQIMGKPVDVTTDIYSLGVVLYGMLTAQVPFDPPENGGNQFAVLSFHIANTPPPKINSIRGVSVHPRVEELVDRCLSKNPSGRPKSARELAAEVQKVLEIVEAAAPSTGEKIEERYLIGEVIGGRSAIGTGEYRAARALSDNSDVTIKLMTVFTDDERRALIDGVNALIKVRHSNLAEVKEIGITPKHMAYIVMENVGTVNVRQKIDSHDIDKDNALDIALQVCEGISFAHGKNQMHRNLKPESIFLREEDGRLQVKILDLGFGSMSRRIKASVLGARVTTKSAYIAPEYLTGQTVTPDDPRPDIYAVGVMLYEMLGGKIGEGLFSPNYKGTEMEGAKALQLIIERATNANPEERYRTMEELKTAITSIVSIRKGMAGENTVAVQLDQLRIRGGASATTVPPATTLPPPTPIAPPRKKRWPAAALGIATLATIVGLGFAATRFRDRPTMSEPARRVATIATPIPTPRVDVPVVAPVALVNPEVSPPAPRAIVTHNITFSADGKHFEVYLADFSGNATGEAVCNSESARNCTATVEHSSAEVRFVVRKRNKPDQIVTIVPDTNRSVAVQFNSRRDAGQRPRSRHRDNEGDLSGARPDV